MGMWENLRADEEPARVERDEAWARERFGDIGERPSDDVVADPDAPDQPRGLAHPK